MMDLERFEELWSQRDQVEDSVRAELDQMVKTDPQCKSFAEGGDWVRAMLQDTEPEKAPADFAYRMRVYAANHSESSPPQTEKSWLRWPVITVGAAAGVAVMVLTLSPVLQNNSVVTGVPVGMAEKDAPADVRPTATMTAESIDSQLLAAADDSLATDSLNSLERDIPDFDIQTVSTGD
jgi:hypothetical protein